MTDSCFELTDYVLGMANVENEIRQFVVIAIDYVDRLSDDVRRLSSEKDAKRFWQRKKRRILTKAIARRERLMAIVMLYGSDAKLFVCDVGNELQTAQDQADWIDQMCSESLGGFQLPEVFKLRLMLAKRHINQFIIVEL